ncbi:MAG: type III-B CRISPR-associated protein Cas10/Cmr2 [Leptolyngbyaceae cyanobacterium bins.302]|nr:type III-B CRISPR-associated protein Cas10/Cmr2 [Leptolyngbyaceae cyanobacterium bins.302]
MVLQNTDHSESQRQTILAITWCLAWGRGVKPQHTDVITQVKQALQNNQPLPDSAQPFLALAQQLHELAFPATSADLETQVRQHPDLWNAQIGLVYGGATKIKQYVFEAAKLPDIRGASALLDRINLVDLPAFFGRDPDDETRYRRLETVDDWLDANQFGTLKDALIPELIVYSTGGNILAFCPAAVVSELANAIEKRYTEETLTANSCAIGATFRPLEIRFGLLQDPIEQTFWFDKLQTQKDNPAIHAYFGLSKPAKDVSDADLRKAFAERKNFNELVGKLATQFNLRRSGFDQEPERPSRRYPPMLETHPYLRRDDSDRSSAVFQIEDLPSKPWVSEPLARKRKIGELTKQESAEDRKWYTKTCLKWGAEAPSSWVSKFEQFLVQEQLVEVYDSDYQIFNPNYRTLEEHQQVRSLPDREARSLKEISEVSDGFVAYIYADGNNMGQYIRDQIKTPQIYQQFSEDIFEATERSVYHALAHHLKPHYHTPDAQSNRTNKSPVWLHPFEIVTIGGDDVLLIVPANQALEIAKMIGEKFEDILVGKGRYPIQAASQRSPQTPLQKGGSDRIHRYKPDQAISRDCCLSISSGVLITADNTPIYYADKLVSQLLKSAKKRAKVLKDKGYYGGTVDFLTLKAVTMISSNIEAFRKEGLTINRPGQQLKLYAAPYTLHELGGLLETAKALKKAKFPRSQLYQIRSLLERGKRTAILNYRYFRVRLDKDKQVLLQTDFENAWCEAETNNGNLAPWLTANRGEDKTIYETLWRELVELYPFIDEPDSESASTSEAVEQGGTVR